MYAFIRVFCSFIDFDTSFKSLRHLLIHFFSQALLGGFLVAFLRFLSVDVNYYFKIIVNMDDK